jgi:hypothetical protein
VTAILLIASARCRAQVTFFSGDATAFEPEVSTSFGGALLDAMVNVSADRKYVTIGAQPTFQGQPQLRPFSFVAGSGFVGMSSLAGAGTPPPQVTPNPGVLNKPGMTLISPLGP